VEEGAVLAGKYLIGPTLGEGGMGVVVAATHLQLDQPVALKFLRPEALRNAEVVARFAREARAAAKIQSQHVVRILDVGTLENGAPFMVMERLEGEDLSRTLARHERLSIADAVDYVLQACEALAEAHALDMVHRDLKPANLFLARRPGGRPLVKVLDFGISKLPTSMDSVSLTRTTGFIGSPPYMSPEQLAASRSVDARSDIWSLGIVLYELLTKRTPFEGQSMPVMIASILHQTPDSPRSRRADIPEALDAAVMKCLQLEPEKRFADVAFLAAAIGPFGSRGSAESVDRISRLLHVRQPPVAQTAVSHADSVASEDSAAAQDPAPRERGAAAPTAGRARTQPKPKVSQARSQFRTQRRAEPRRGMLVALVVVGVIAIAGGIVGTWLTMHGAPQEAGTENSAEGAPAAAQKPALSKPLVREPTPPPTPVAQPAPPKPVSPPPEPSPVPEVVEPVELSRPSPAPAVKPSGAHRPKAPPASEPKTVVAPSVKSPSPAGKGSGSAECARLLERQSLGETLSPAEAAVYKAQCRR
jgi:serine/threonine-protein kinase